MTNGGKAFAKGGIGCLVGFVVLAVDCGSLLPLLARQLAASRSGPSENGESPRPAGWPDESGSRL